MEEKTWVAAYEEELNHKKRREILQVAIEEEGRTPANELREKLLDARYETVKGKEIDRFIRGWMELDFVKGQSVFGKKSREKAREKLREDLGFTVAAPYGEEGEDVLYREYRNTARLFLKLCQEDRSYSAVLFGLGRMKQSSLISKLAGTFYKAAVEAPERIGMTEELRPFRRALVEIFTESYPDDRELLTDRLSK